MEEIARIIDETADKISLFLKIDNTSKITLIDEILAQKNVIKKVEQFAFLVIDRMQFQNTPKRDFAQDIMTNVSKLVPETPDDLNKFSLWVPNYIKNTQNEIELLKLKLKKCQIHINKSEKIMEKFSKDSNSKIEQLKYKLEDFKEQNSKLRKENEKIRSDYEYGEKERSILLSRLNSVNAELNARKEVQFIPPETIDLNHSLLHKINNLQTRLKNTEKLHDNYLSSKNECHSNLYA